MSSPVAKHKAFEERIDQAMSHIKSDCGNLGSDAIQAGIGKSIQSAIDSAMDKGAKRMDIENTFQEGLNHLKIADSQQRGFKGIFEATKDFLSAEMGLIKRTEHVPGQENLDDYTVRELGTSAQEIISRSARHNLNIMVGPSMSKGMEDTMKTVMTMLHHAGAFLKKKSHW